MRRTSIASLAVLVASLAFAPRAGAHRLDECLQAMRVTIDIDRISLDLDLTPGASIADRMFATLLAPVNGLDARFESETQPSSNEHGSGMHPPLPWAVSCRGMPGAASVFRAHTASPKDMWPHGLRSS